MVLLCVIFKGVWYARHFEFRLSTPASDVHVRLKITGTAIKTAKETTQQNKYNSVKHSQRQLTVFICKDKYFKIKVSKNPESCKHVIEGIF